MGCAVSPAGCWRVTRYPKPSGGPQPPPNWGLSDPPKGLSAPRGLQGPAEAKVLVIPRAPCQGARNLPCRASSSILNVTQTYNASRNRPLMPLKASRLLSDQEFCSKHKLPGPDKIVVQDWERAPSKETKGLEPSPNPNDKSSVQTQLQLFKIGGIQSMRREEN